MDKVCAYRAWDSRFKFQQVRFCLLCSFTSSSYSLSVSPSSFVLLLTRTLISSGVSGTEDHVCWPDIGEFTTCLAFLISLEIRVVIYFLWLKDFPNIKISHEIDSIDGEIVIILKAIRNWMHYFAEESYSLKDTPRTDRPRSTKYVDATRALLTDDLYLSQKWIAFILNIHQSIVKYILHKELSLRKVNFKWIPHLLDGDQELERTRLSTELLEFFESKSGP
jgi:hypothetical protein